MALVVSGVKAILDIHYAAPFAGQMEPEVEVISRRKRELNLVPVAPDILCPQWLIDCKTVDPADVPEAFRDLALFISELGVVRKRLPGAAATDAEMVALWFQALRRGVQQLLHPGFGMGAPGVRHNRPHPVTRYGALDKDDKAILARYPSTTEGKAGN